MRRDRNRTVTRLIRSRWHPLVLDKDRIAAGTNRAEAASNPRLTDSDGLAPVLSFAITTARLSSLDGPTGAVAWMREDVVVRGEHVYSDGLLGGARAAAIRAADLGSYRGAASNTMT